MENYTKGWEGQFNTSKTLNFTVEIENLNTDNSVFRISNDRSFINQTFPNNTNLIDIFINERLSFTGELNKDKSTINGFIKSGFFLYHIKLTKKNSQTYTGKWNIFIVDELKSKSFYLSVENGSRENYEAYPIFGDNRFTGTWCSDFKKNKNVIFFTDLKTGLSFKGLLGESKILLDVYLANKLVTQIELTPSKEDWKIGQFKANNTPKTPKLLNDGWKVSTSKHLNNEMLHKMEDSINSNALENTHSVLIVRKGKLIYENYFSGYNSSIPHDMRSASKSISSAIIGIIIDKKMIADENEKLFDFLPEKHKTTMDTLKKEISIHSLLTMSSGLDAIDFGIKRKSYATENNYQQQKDITKYILEAPMLYRPNLHSNYGSANPYLLGIIANSVISEPLELFMDKTLLQKLEISNYIIQSDGHGVPYFGGGMYLTPRDMLKFGQLYLCEGKWKNKRVISKEWVKKSFKNYHILENTLDKNGYGYLWWHKIYNVDGRLIKSIEARGAGGQYIFVIPKLKTVVVITSSNFRNGKFQQPENILENYILPSILN
ncbi:serine hydrolase [Aquimarina sp. I32.4]|uniref:serine hydrolase domain-containing protein n=1 Tax=Aquimarina sp. I32.4 TaxID=2053903 RepID=UPI0013049E82|nr:serine hydrolase [Aquimarina sp. I32.4]